MALNSHSIDTNILIAPFWRSRSKRGWRYLIAILAAVSFVLLVTTVTTHHHAASLEEQACSLCMAVTHKLVDTPTPATVGPVVAIQLYQVFVGNQLYAVPASPIHLPPSRGPPLL